jgi:hypothetical protein
MTICMGFEAKYSASLPVRGVNAKKTPQRLRVMV